MLKVCLLHSSLYSSRCDTYILIVLQKDEDHRIGGEAIRNASLTNRHRKRLPSPASSRSSSASLSRGASPPLERTTGPSTLSEKTPIPDAPIPTTSTANELDRPTITAPDPVDYTSSSAASVHPDTDPSTSNPLSQTQGPRPQTPVQPSMKRKEPSSPNPPKNKRSPRRPKHSGRSKANADENHSTHDGTRNTKRQRSTASDVSELTMMMMDERNERMQEREERREEREHREAQTQKLFDEIHRGHEVFEHGQQQTHDFHMQFLSPFKQMAGGDSQ